MTSIRVRGRIVATALAFVVGAACAQQETVDGPPCDGTWPEAPADALHVSAVCGQAAGDGSPARPLPTLADAVEQLAPGQTIVLGSGTFVGGVTLPCSVTVAGAGAGDTVVDGGLIFKPAGAAGPVAVRGMTVRKGSGTGISAINCSLYVVGATIKHTQSVSKGGGHGVQVVGAPKLVLRQTRIEANAGVGLLASGVGQVLVGDRAGPSPRVAGGKGGEVVTGWVADSAIGGNLGGGVYIAGDGMRGGGLVHSVAGAWVLDNRTYGVAVYNGILDVDRSVIQKTRRHPNADHADGVVLGQADGASVVHLRVGPDCVIGHNERAGVLIAAVGTAEVHADVSKNGLGGLAVQAPTSELTTASQALLAHNSGFGAVVTNGGRLILDGATIRDTAFSSHGSPSGGLPCTLAAGLLIGEGGRASLERGMIRGTLGSAIRLQNPGHVGEHADVVVGDNLLIRDTPAAFSVSKSSKHKSHPSWSNAHIDKSVGVMTIEVKACSAF